jgi:hypothetical protein
MQVDMRRFDRLMTEPQRNHGGIDAPCRSSIAAVCLKTCGDTRLDFNDGHLSPATRTYLARSDWTLSNETRRVALDQLSVRSARGGSMLNTLWIEARSRCSATRYEFSASRN